MVDAVVQGTGTITDSEMPFVNRFQELWLIFRFNAMIQRQIIKSKTEIENFRSLNLLFCVQARFADEVSMGQISMFSFFLS